MKKNKYYWDFGVKFCETGISYEGRMEQIAKRVNHKLHGISWEIRRDTINEVTKNYFDAVDRGIFRAKYGDRSKTDFLNTIVDRRCADVIRWIQRERDQRRWGRGSADGDAGKQTGLSSGVRWGTALRQIYIDEDDNLDKFLGAGDKPQYSLKRSRDAGPAERYEKREFNRKTFWYPTMFPKWARQFPGMKLGKTISKGNEQPGHIHTGFVYIHVVDGLKIKEIAELFNLPFNAVKKAVEYGVKTYKARVHDLGYIRERQCLDPAIDLILRGTDKTKYAGGKMVDFRFKQGNHYHVGKFWAINQPSSQVWQRHLEFLNICREISNQHASEYKVCAKCHKRGKVQHCLKANGLTYCLNCWSELGPGRGLRWLDLHDENRWALDFFFKNCAVWPKFQTI